MRASDRPDELTPREREVFDLLRLGLTNEEIAVRIGISLDGAKYHVSQILSKLGVSSREEAARTTLEPPTAVAEAEEPRPSRGGGQPLLGKAAGIAVIAGAVGGLGILAWSVLAMGGEAGDSVQPAADGPRIGDHWHAPYQFFACREIVPNATTWESGVHTHADGILHIHPFEAFEEGAGASLVKWFEYGGGLLTETEINIPGHEKTYRNGDLCPGGERGELQVFVTRLGASAEERLEGDALQGYIPHDGDRIRIVFGPPEDPITYAPETTFAEPTLAAESPLPSWTIPPCDRPAATIRASYAPAAPRPTTVVVDAWNSQGGICLRVESVVLQPLGVGLVLVNLTISNGSSADIVYEYAGFSVVNADGASFLASEQTPSPDLQTIHAFETKWAQLTFQAIKGVPLHELVWRPEGLPEIRVPLQGDVPITTE